MGTICCHRLTSSDAGRLSPRHYYDLTKCLQPLILFQVEDQNSVLPLQLSLALEGHPNPNLLPHKLSLVTPSVHGSTRVLSRARRFEPSYIERQTMRLP